MSGDWKRRIDEMMAALKASESTVVRQAEVGAPVTQAEIDEVHASIGYELDPRFLDFFRAANGLRVIWVTKSYEAIDDPVEHFQYAQEDIVPTGRINVPPLRELFEQPGYLFGPDVCKPNEYTEPCLGGWDSHALRSSLRNIDDFDQTPGDASYYVVGLVASKRYPDPPVLLTTDYTAALSDAHPMLARDYLAFVIATFGRPLSRHDRLKSRGAGGNHDLFVPPPGWLDALPAADKVLAAIYDEASPGDDEEVTPTLKPVATCDGIPVDQTPYASYNQPPAGPPRVASDDPMEGMRVITEPETEHQAYYLDEAGYDGPMTVPLYDESHYTIKEPVNDASALSALIGQPVKAETRYGTNVGCLIRVEGDEGTLFNAGDGYAGTTSFAMRDAESVGRAWYLG